MMSKTIRNFKRVGSKQGLDFATVSLWPGGLLSKEPVENDVVIFTEPPNRGSRPSCWRWLSTGAWIEDQEHVRSLEWKYDHEKSRLERLDAERLMSVDAQLKYGLLMDDLQREGEK